MTRLPKVIVKILTEKNRSFGKEKILEVSECSKACRKLLRGQVIPCPLTSIFSVPFTEEFDTALLD